MKKQLLLAGVAVVALIGNAPSQAADLPVKAPPMAPPPPPAFTWTGCYIGGQVGLATGAKTFSDQPGGNPLAGGSGVPVGTFGGLGGGQIGCNYQFATNWVLGIEGAGAGGNIEGNAISLNGKSLNARTDWLASATGRLGYVWNQMLLMYVKGGAAWAGDKYQVTEATSTPNTYSLSQTRFGWTVGVGGELALSTNWSVRAEYNYYGFGSQSNLFFACSNPVSSSLCIGSPFGTLRGPETINQQISEFTVGVNYRFY